MVRNYVEKPNCIILAISLANQDIATLDAIKLAREVDATGERTFGVLTKLDLMDKGTHVLDVQEGRSYRLQHPWHLKSVIRARIPSIASLINKSIDELESELDHLGRPIVVDAAAQLYNIFELCRAFDKIFKEHLDGGRPGGDRIYGVFDNQLPAALRKLPFDHHLSIQNGPAEASVDAAHFVLKELVRKSIGECQELKRFPTLQSAIAGAGNQSLEKFREEGKKTVTRLVDMESSYLTVDFFRRLLQEIEKVGNQGETHVKTHERTQQPPLPLIILQMDISGG